MKTIGIYRKIGDQPPMDWFACGAFANGYGPVFASPSEFFADIAPDLDCVAVGGGKQRYHWKNNEIITHYQKRGVPAITVEFSWLLPDHVFTYYGPDAWIPPDDMVTPARRLQNGWTVEHKTRGEHILVAGQSYDMDAEMLPILYDIHQHSGRPIHYRRHPNAKRMAPDSMFHIPFAMYDSDYDTIPDAQASIDLDLRNAWCVVTTSSNIAHDALLRGIPVVCHKDAVMAGVSTTWNDVRSVDDLYPPPRDEVESYFDRLAYAHWSHEEIRHGGAFNFLKQIWE